MKEKKSKKIDFSIESAERLADKYYNEGKYVDALRWAFKAYDMWENGCFWVDVRDCYARIADIYEAMGLHGSAILWLYRYLHIAKEEDLSEIYEGIAVNYLNMGKEAQSAYYYNKLIDTDDTLPPEAKIEIAEAFSKQKNSGFRFTYPPKLADFSLEVHAGQKALKEGNAKQAVELFSVVERGSKDYATAREMQAVAHLLNGETEEALQACLDALKEDPDDVRATATLCAVYLEMDRKEDSKVLAELLCKMEITSTDDIYKVATVCCENGMHEEAYKRFCIVEKDMPYDGRTTYFKAVAAYKSGLYAEAERAFTTLCDVYPDAEVARFYLRQLRNYKTALENGEQPIPLIEPTYYYHLPQSERETRCKTLLEISKLDKQDAQLFVDEHTDELIRWCFDEMDGADHELQYLGLVVAVHTDRLAFLQDVFLDGEVLDALKVETLRMIYEKNLTLEMGIVLYHIYRNIHILPIKIGRKRRQKFINAYAKVSSRFAVIRDDYGQKLKTATEKLYRRLESREVLDKINNQDDLACAIFSYANLKEIQGGIDAVCALLDGNANAVEEILALAQGESKEKEEKEG